MEGLTLASPDSLPPPGQLIADEPFWKYPISTAGTAVAHLRVWLTSGPEPGYMAVVTDIGSAAEVIESAGQIWAHLVRRYGPSLMLLEHHPAPEIGEDTETLDLVRVGADGSAHWLRVWPTPEENPRHTGLELWMAVHPAGQPLDGPLGQPVPGVALVESARRSPNGSATPVGWASKLPSGLWQATVRGRDGKRHSTTDKLKSVVKHWAAEQEAAIARGNFRDPWLGDTKVGEWYPASPPLAQPTPRPRRSTPACGRPIVSLSGPVGTGRSRVGASARPGRASARGRLPAGESIRKRMYRYTKYRTKSTYGVWIGKIL